MGGPECRIVVAHGRTVAPRTARRGGDVREYGAEMSDNVRYEVDGRIATVTLTRPEKLNAITLALQQDLLAALEQAEADPGIHVAIVVGEGRGFSAGYDVTGGNNIAPGVTNDRDWLEVVLRGWLRIWDLRLAVIAQVHGVCLAGGTQLASICDIGFVAQDCKIGTPQLPLGAGFVSTFWTWFIGPKKAKEIFFPTGTLITGADAVAMGLFNRAYPADRLAEETRRYAELVARTPKEIIALQKQSINRTQELAGFRQALMQGVEIDTIAHVSPPVRTVNRFIAERGLREALRAYQAGELL